MLVKTLLEGASNGDDPQNSGNRGVEKYVVMGREFRGTAVLYVSDKK